MTACSYLFLFAVIIWDPANLITFTGESQSDYDDGARAAGFALIAAMAIVIQRIPGQETSTGKAIDLLLGIAATFTTFMAAWWWLADETNGNPHLYLEEILVVPG